MRRRWQQSKVLLQRHHTGARAPRRFVGIKINYFIKGCSRQDCNKKRRRSRPRVPPTRITGNYFCRLRGTQPHAQARHSQPPGQNIITFGNLGMEAAAVAGTAPLALARSCKTPSLLSLRLLVLPSRCLKTRRRDAFSLATSVFALLWCNWTFHPAGTPD